MYYKISRLILTATSGKPSTTADIFISNPQIDQEALLGKLFLLAEIESNKPFALKIINFFISTLPTHYYQSDKISLREKMGTIKIGEIFETVLAKTNAEFENFLKKEKIKVNPKAINIVVGVICKNDLVFSTVGKIKALLIHNEKAKDDSSSERGDKKLYKITNIEEQDEIDKKVHLNKIFSNITEGKIPPEGYLVFSNEILPEYINNKHLTKIITTLPPLSTIEHLKSRLHKTNSYVTFLAVIIKNSTTPQIKRTISKMQINVTASNSLERMNETESEAEKYLSPAGIINTNRYTAFVKNIFRKVTGPREQGATTAIRDKLLFVKKHRLNFLAKLYYHLKNFFIIAVNIIVYFSRLLAHPKELIYKISRAFQDIYNKIKLSFLGTLRWFINLSTASKILLITFIISSMLFTYNLYYLSYTKNEQVEQQNYQETVQLIKQKQNQVEASLLYHNEEKAQQLITATAILIEQLKQFKKIDQKLIARFIEVNNEQIEKISHVVAIDNPKELANFKQLNAMASPQSIVILEQNIIVADASNSSLYQLNLIDNTISVLSSNASNIDYKAGSEDNKTLFISAGGRLTLDDEMNITTVESLIIDNAHDITDTAYYNNRLYILSAPKNNIFRYAKSFKTYDSWIKEALNINDAVSLAIDGYVYILKRNGEVLKMLSGYSSEFELPIINPPFSNPRKIKLSGDSEDGYIYILEPSQNRLVVFNKAARFILQYKIKDFNDLRDFVILEKEDSDDNEIEKIILLNGTSVYEISTEDLK